MANIPLKEFRCMALGTLSDQLDAYAILNDYADEYVEPQYVPDLR